MIASQRYLRLVRKRAPRTFVWGFIDQGASSAGNLLVSVVAGRLLGPSGLGIIFIGFSSYLVALGLLRAFVVDPLIAMSSTTTDTAKGLADRAGLTIVGCVGCVSSGILVAVGFFTSGSFTRGLLVFGPWLLPALVQDYLRCLLFRDGRGKFVTVLDGTWLLILVCSIPFVVWIDADWAVASAWGIGALVAATMGLFSVRIRPQRPLKALAWWRENAVSLGRWLAGASVVYTVCSYAGVLILGLVLGTVDLGGFRAVLSAMTPLSLIVPALSLPGLPALARASARSTGEATRLATRLGLGASVIASAYVLIFGLAPGLLGALFGDSFSGYASLVWPLGCGQSVAAAAIGFILLLKAQRRGRAFFAARSVASVMSLVFPVSLAIAYGLEGAAWGFAAAAMAGASVTVAVALSKPRHRPAVTHSADGATAPRWSGSP